MDAVSYAHSAKQAKRIKRFIENPDSNSGVLTQPKVIEAGETVTIKSGRQAILADTVVDGDLVIEAGGDVFVPAGAGFGVLESQIALKADTSYVDGKYSGFKNYIINGGFDIDQRNNKAGFTIAAGGYAFSADRWAINNTTNQPVSIIVADFPTPSGGRVGRLRIKFDTAPTSGYIQIFQRIENVSILGGKQVTLSHSFDCDAMTITNDTTQNFGSGGSSNVGTIFSNIYTTGILSSLTRFSSSITLPSVDGKTIGTGSYTQITYSLPIRTTNIQTITQVQLEEGSAATPFENRPIGLELSLCQRYYQKIAWSDRKTTTATGQYLHQSIRLPVDMRVTPTVTNINVGQVANATFIGIANFSNMHVRVEASSNAAGDSYILNRVDSLSAEL